GVLVRYREVAGVLVVYRLLSLPPYRAERKARATISAAMPAAPTTSPVTAPNRRRASRAPASATSAPRASAPAPRRFAARIDAASAIAATAAVIRSPAATSGPARAPAAARGEVAMVTTMAVRPATGTATRKPQRCWDARRAMNDQRASSAAPNDAAPTAPMAGSRITS